MKAYVALLRSINVSGHHIIKMADLKNLLERPEFLNLTSYLQSGNLVFQSDVEDHHALENLISEVIKDHYAYDIKVKVFDREAFQKSYVNNPFLNRPEVDVKKLYYLHVIGEPDMAEFDKIRLDKRFSEEMVLVKDTIYVYYSKGYGRSKLSGVIFEKNLKLSITARNNNTMKNLLEKLESL